MLTPLLEKAILNGWATFRIHNHAFSNFGRIIIPENSTVIITHVKWYPFFNPAFDNERLIRMTWREFFKYNEFQLKINAKKSVNFLIFRNEFDYQWTTPTNINLDERIDTDLIKNYLLIMQRRPITTHVYFKCEQYIKLTLQRNTFINKITDANGALSPKTDEQKPQVGLEGVKILLNTEMQSFNGNVQNYVMGNYQDANLNGAITNQTMEANYMQGFADPDSIFSPFEKSLQPYQTHPLVEIGYVVVNSNKFDTLQNV